MEIQKIKIDQIKQNPDNPRVIKDDKFDKLVQSIKEFPEMLSVRPCVVNTKFMILGGNQRWHAGKEAGLKEIPVIIVKGWSKAKQKEFVIKDNVSSGDWDWKLLSTDWETEILAGWGMEVLNFGNTDMLDTVNKGSEDDEWVGMPAFERKNGYLKIIINFENEEDRIEFAKKHKLKFMKKEARWWSTIFPFRKRDDLKAQIHE